MAGSGLQELIEIMFAGNAVRHMWTGKAISRAEQFVATRWKMLH